MRRLCDPCDFHKRLVRGLFFATFVLSCLVGVAGIALGTEFRGGDAVQITGAEILDDLFLAGGDIGVDAHIVGDLFAAGATVSLGDSGVVENSMMAAGQRVDINGNVVNSARVFAQYITVRGHIERNLMAFSATLIVEGTGWVENDISVFGGSAIIRGRVGGKVDGAIGQIVIAGQIDGDVDVEADEITILPTAIIGGKLRYKSPNEPKIEEGAQVFGGTERVEPDKRQTSAYTFGSFLWDSWWFLAKVMVGIALLILFRPFMDMVKDTILDSSVKSLGLGFLFLVCLPVAAGVLAITLLGIPLAFLIVIGWLVLLYVSMVLVGFATGEWLLGRLRGGRKSPVVASLFAGLFVLTIASMIPYFGFLVRLMVVSLGFGAFLMTAYRFRTGNGSTAA